MLVYKRGDVLNSGETFIIHGCNCFNTMGSGIAKQIREQYPEAWEADQETTRGDHTKLGRYTFGIKEIDNKLIYIINAYTQYRYGHDKVYADYEAIEKVFTDLCKDFDTVKIFALPKIGSGLAGGDWSIIEEILDRVSEEYNKTFHVYELPPTEVQKKVKPNVKEMYL